MTHHETLRAQCIHVMLRSLIKFSRESPYISYKISRESPKFHTSFHVGKRSPRHSKDLSGKLIDLEIWISLRSDLLHEVGTIHSTHSSTRLSRIRTRHNFRRAGFRRLKGKTGTPRVRTDRANQIGSMLPKKLQLLTYPESQGQTQF